MKKIVIILALILKVKMIYSQTVFQKTVQVPISFAYVTPQATSDGGYIVAGSIISFTNSDIYLLKTDSSGSVEWVKKYEGNYADFSISARQTADGGYIITGSTKISSGSYSEKVLLMKTDSNGDTLWTRTYGSPGYNWFGYTVRQNADHGYIIAGGYTNGLLDSQHLIRTDSIGNLLWAKEYLSLSFDLDKALPTPDGGFIFIIYNGDLIKTDALGFPYWIKRFQPPFVNDVGLTTDHGYILAGAYYQPGGLYDAYLVKTDSLGDTLWTKAYNVMNFSSYAKSVQQTSDGGYAVTGILVDSVQTDVFILKTDSIGNVLWMKKYGGLENDYATYIQEAGSGGFFVAGTSASFGTAWMDIYFIKTDQSGNSGCNDSILNPVVFVPGLNSSIVSGAYIKTLVTGNALIPVDTIVPQQITLCSSSVNIESISVSDNNIFPNPFTSEISIDIKKENIKHFLFSVNDILGQSLFNQQENNLSNTHIKTFDLSFLSKGIYLIVIDIDGERLVKKIVKD